MMDNKAKGLLIDYGGVLTNPIGQVLTEFCRRHGLADDAFAALQAPDCAFRSELEAFERGAYREEDFLPHLAHVLGLSPSAITGFLAGVCPDAAMFAALDSIRAQGIPIGLLSNSWGMSAYPQDLLDRTFDTIVISGRVGMRKPEPEIYHHAARSIRLKPEDCVFVDDTAANLAPAAAVGMRVLHHCHASTTLQELERLFGITIHRAA